MVGLVTAFTLARLLLAPPTFEVKGHIPIGGTGGWDYLAFEPKSQRVFVTQGNRVVVVDAKAQKVVGSVTGLARIHGVVFDMAKNHGFVTNGGDNTVKVFDLKTLQVVGSVPTGTGPDGMVFDPATRQVISFNGRGQNCTFIDADSLTATATLALGGKPEFPAADGKGIVYANVENTSEVVKIDSKAHTILARYPIAPAEGPSGLAIDAKNDITFSVCDGTMVVLDGTSGKILATPKIGQGPDAAAYDPKLGLAFSSNGQDGTLSIVGKTANGYETIQTLTTMTSARTLAYDPIHHVAYLAAAKLAAAQEGQRRPASIPDSFELVVVGLK